MSVHKKRRHRFVWILRYLLNFQISRWNVHALFFPLILTIQIGFAQSVDKRFEPILVSDGLVQSAVSDILRDQYDYVWFGTRGGLSRFDGTEFVNFQHNPDDSLSLSHGSVWALNTLSDGSFWIGTTNGLNKYDWSREHFIRYQSQDLSGIRIQKIHEWSEDTLMLATQRGIYFFDRVSNTFSRKALFDSMNELNVQDFHFTDDGTIVLGSEIGIHKISKSKVEFFELDLVKAVYIDDNDNIWAATERKIHLISADFKTNRIVGANSNLPQAGEIISDGNGNVIVAKGRVEIYNLNGQLVESYSHESNRDFSLLDDIASCIEIDQDGIWWIGLDGVGANMYDPNRPTLGLLRHIPNKTPSLSSNYITSFFTEDDSTVFIGTSGGLDVFDSRSLSVQNIFSSNIDYLYRDNQNLWAASDDTLLIIDPDRKRVKNRLFIDNLRRIKAMMRGMDDILWIATQSGLIKYNLKSNTYQVKIPNDPKVRKPSTDWITAIYDSGDRYLIGSSIGFYEMDKSSEMVKKLDRAPFDELKNTYIKCIEADDKGNLWIGTWGEGLYKLDQTSNTIQQYTMNDGLPNDVIYGVLQDEKGYLWMSSNFGITRFDEANKEFTTLDVNYGLQSNEFNTSAYFKSPNSMFYFGGVEGLNYFHPEGIENPKKPETLITGFYLSNNRVSPQDLNASSGAIMDLDTIILNHKQNMLSFDFKGSNLTISRLNQYAYYLENLENDWNYVGNRRFANYSGLQPGNYIFKVKSSNNNGVWDTTPDQMVIIITQPYWQAAWFRLMVIGIILIASVVFYRYRLYSLKRNQKRLKFLVSERTKELKTSNLKLHETNRNLEKSIKERKIAQEQMVQNEKMAAIGVLAAGVGHEINNPLNFIKNGTVTLESEINKSKIDISDKMSHCIRIIHEGTDRASQIVKSLSHFSRSDNSIIEACDIHAIIDNCLVILNSSIRNKVEVVKNYVSADVIIQGNGGKLHQAFMNILSNAEQAIQTKGTITISTEIEKNYLKVKISDTGDGIEDENLKKIVDPFFTTKEAGKGTGLGLSITHAILEEHKGHLQISSEKKQGSTFTISLPLHIN